MWGLFKISYQSVLKMIFKSLFQNRLWHHSSVATIEGAEFYQGYIIMVFFKYSLFHYECSIRVVFDCSIRVHLTAQY